ncbi:hypothetical protein Droror1_Dr00026792 [Drosera rotundifolia]
MTTVSSEVEEEGKRERWLRQLVAVEGGGGGGEEEGEEGRGVQNGPIVLFLLLFQSPEKACPSIKSLAPTDPGATHNHHRAQQPANRQINPTPVTITTTTTAGISEARSQKRHRILHSTPLLFQDPKFQWISQTIGDELTSMEAAFLRHGCLLGAKFWPCKFLSNH